MLTWPDSSRRGEYIVLMDGDLTYDPKAIPDMIAILQSGNYDLVMGSRLKGVILPGAMPALHRYIGNPALTWIFRMPTVAFVPLAKMH
jgi:glycosyltransferase involved in cell wall biosynthesis